MKFNKPTTTVDQQLDILKERGLRIRHHQKAHQILSEINYYRLSAYYLPFQKDKIQHQFYPNATFEKIVKLYRFDEALRNIIMPIIESAEILIRMRITYYLVLKYDDPFCYLDKELYKDKFIGNQLAREDFISFVEESQIVDIWNLLVERNYINSKGRILKREIMHDDFNGIDESIIESIKQIFTLSSFDIWFGKMDDSIKESKEEFARHYLEKYYDDSPGFPLWMATEMISFGQLSKLYAGLDSEHRTNIAKQYGLKHSILLNWLHSIVYVRNMCAHHSRLWNRELEIRPRRPNNLPEANLWTNRVFTILLVLKYLTPKNYCWARIVWRLCWLFLNNQFVDKEAMGFPKHWMFVLLSKKGVV